jgi:hypothetical protein
MKVICPASLVLLVLGGSVASAQQPLVTRATAAPATTLQSPLPAGEQFTPPNLTLPAVTPELWLYSQELRRHDDPAQAVRRKAEERAQQRTQRLAAMKWYGLSNSRPQASTTPFMSVYSPAWVGNGYNRYDWGRSWVPTFTLQVENYGVVR